MWAGFFGPTRSFLERHAAPGWPEGFRTRTAHLRPYIMHFGRGYPHVANGPIRATGWYALDVHEHVRYPYGPFPSRLAAGKWWQRWVANTGSRCPSWAKRYTDVPWSGIAPRDRVRFRRLAPSYGVQPPRARQPRRPGHPLSTGRGISLAPDILTLAGTAALRWRKEDLLAHMQAMSVAWEKAGVMTACELWIGPPVELELNGDVLPPGELLQDTSTPFPLGEAAYFALRDKIATGAVRGERGDWGRYAALMRRAEVEAFLEEVFGAPGAFEARHTGAMAHLAERMRELRAFVAALPADMWAAVFVSEF